jgi:acyl carrier protein
VVVSAARRARGLRANDKRRSTGEGVENQIRAELTEFIVANFLFGDVARAPRDDDTLVEEGIIDSTGILELIEFLETRFGIEVSEAETVPENLGSVSSLTKFVTGKQSVREPTPYVPEHVPSVQMTGAAEEDLRRR